MVKKYLLFTYNCFFMYWLSKHYKQKVVWRTLAIWVPIMRKKNVNTSFNKVFTNRSRTTIDTSTTPSDTSNLALGIWKIIQWHFFTFLLCQHFCYLTPSQFIRLLTKFIFLRWELITRHARDKACFNCIMIFNTTLLIALESNWKNKDFVATVS